MSTTRIKYLKQKDGTEKSVKLYSVKYKTYYYVVKDMTGEYFNFKIVNMNQQRTIYDHLESVPSKITNKAVLYRTIRDKLKTLGIELKTETRPHQSAPPREARVRGGKRSSGKSRRVTDE